MDLLPLEITLKIFGFLNLSDLMTLRLVCKKFECIVRQVKIRELAFMKNSSFYNKDWFSTKDLKDDKGIGSSYLLSRSLSGGPFNVRFLKRLSIGSLSDAKEIELEDINRLQYLEHLEIGFDRQPGKSSSMGSLSDQQLQKQPGKSTRLCLPNLKVLRIISFYNQRQGVQIDAPRLKALELPGTSKYFRAYRPQAPYNPYDPVRLAGDRFESNLWSFTYEYTYKNDASSLNFKHPESIKFLSINHLDPWFKAANFIKTFRNVEYLLVFNNLNLPDATPYLDFILPALERLKTVNLSNGSLSYNTVSQVSHLVDWVASLKNPDLKVYFIGIQVSNNRKFIDDFKFYKQALENEKRTCIMSQEENELTLTMQLENYSLLSDRVDSDPDLRYNVLVEKLLKIRAERGLEFEADRNGQVTLFPDDFFERFPRFCSISAAKIENEEHFTRLVKNCKNLRILCLENSGLSQAFFDQLPAISLLSGLQVKETNELNMSFLFRMNHLAYLITDQRLDWQIALKLAKSRHCKNMCCKIQNRCVIILRKTSDEYSLNIGSDEKVVNLELLTDHLSIVKMASPATIELD